MMTFQEICEYGDLVQNPSGTMVNFPKNLLEKYTILKGSMALFSHVLVYHGPVYNATERNGSGACAIDPFIKVQSLPTWRIIPFSKWLITMVIVSPLTGVIPLINGLFMAYK